MTGNLTIAPVSTGGSFIVNKPVGSFGANLVGQVAGLNRWAVVVGSNAAESTGNAGSDFQLLRFDDAGASLGVSMTIDRKSGNMNWYTTSVTQIGFTSVNFTLWSAASQQANLIFSDAGIAKWQIGKQTDNSFFIYDV